ncbi:SDR family oxidoreductase [Mangrovitalea sediminis]|uniref:SDR family oxidoreductase n=1 Tax=Mangrovitalea sediminis TaxID=1982043 RepID=UPI000BE4B3F6|nr:SDR family oxidoreductase [Mangrovitalea sediminis]
MRVFVTGATGFIGSAIVSELISVGHEVTGLARSEESAKKLRARGATVARGTVEDLEILHQEAGKADGVIHCAFFHALSHMTVGSRLRVMLGGLPTGIVGRFTVTAAGADQRAIEAMGHALKTGAPLIAAFPTMALKAGRLAEETDAADAQSVGGARAQSEQVVKTLAERGLRAVTVRLPPSVHSETKQGLVTQLIAIARKKGVSAYVGAGENRWCAVHRQDAASLFVQALERGEPGAHYHAIGEAPITLRAIAEEIGAVLGVPSRSLSVREAERHFGWLAPFIGTDNPVTSQITQEVLGWAPNGPGLLADMAATPAGASASGQST